MPIRELTHGLIHQRRSTDCGRILSNLIAATVRSIFALFVEIVKSLDLPDWLVHWVHPANMAVVYQEEKAKAKDLHPKPLELYGGATSLFTSDKPIFERYHWAPSVEQTLKQSALPALFERLLYLMISNAHETVKHRLKTNYAD